MMTTVYRNKLGMLAAFAIGASLLAKTTSAEADSAPKADVIVIHATNCEKPMVDPQIGEKPQLGYTCYKVVERKSMQLAQGQGSTMALPNGRTFQLTYNGIVPASNPVRHKIGAAISKPDKSGYLSLADVNAELGKSVNFGGFAHQGGVLIMRVQLQ